MVRDTDGDAMNYAFLLVLFVFAVLAGPLLLWRASAEAKRRRECQLGKQTPEGQDP